VLKELKVALQPGRLVRIGGAPPGQDAAAVLRVAELSSRPVLLVANHDRRMAEIAEALAFLAPSCAVLELPAWDTQPYDRVSPHPDILARRSETLSRLAEDVDSAQVALTTANALLQRLPAPERMVGASWRAEVGDELSPTDLTDRLLQAGYVRTGIVEAPGEFAPRGGVLDVHAVGADAPLRLEIAFDRLESIRRFDPQTQRSAEPVDSIRLRFAGEGALDDAARQRFRRRYLETFGAVSAKDALLDEVAAGWRPPGIEHWLPLLEERLVTLFDYLPESTVIFDERAEPGLADRREMIADLYAARLASRVEAQRQGRRILRALPPDRLYVEEGELQAALASRPVCRLASEALPEAPGNFDAGGRQGRNFLPERIESGSDLFLEVRSHVEALWRSGRRVMLSAVSEGSRARMVGLLRDAGLESVPVASWEQFRRKVRPGMAAVGLAVWRLANGFIAEGHAVISEEDLFGNRLGAAPSRGRRRRPSVAGERIRLPDELEPGDIVVHEDFGIGRFRELGCVVADGVRHDCVKLEYDRGDMLSVPVENLDLLYRYGEVDMPKLDRLGGAGWQLRKAAAYKGVLEIAGELIETAARREVGAAPMLEPGPGYDAFCARFPWLETDDQLAAVDEMFADLRSGRPMDRLLCGDVGFGKTEVAMRAAHAAVFSGCQVAVVTPTTLLARQHYDSFRERFAGLGVEIGMLSRLQSAKEADRVRRSLADGGIAIAVGTQALLARQLRFADLGLVIVDEEHQFGVRQKERLKALRSEVHALTLTATPIPRTLQLAMSGLRSISRIQTPPIDRLAVRTYVMPFDSLTVREALLREQARNGQSFLVVDRIVALPSMEAFLKESVPEVRFRILHGQMPGAEIELGIDEFRDGAFDVLLSTSIVGFGLDIPRANTLVVAGAERFGLAQLYQLRGRVGRSKLRAYAYFTYRENLQLTETAVRRMTALRSVEELGGGFRLASHDLDIRGTGNLLGTQQSGKIRAVGVGLYQAMLSSAVKRLREGGAAALEERWSPVISLAVPAALPETYVSDLPARLALYRRLAEAGNWQAVQSLAAEIHDRFGPPPPEVEMLYQLVGLKAVCRAGGIRSVEGGGKGVRVRLHESMQDRTSALVAFVSRRREEVSLRNDGSLLLNRRLSEAAARMKAAVAFCEDLAASLAASNENAAAAAGLGG